MATTRLELDEQTAKRKEAERWNRIKEMPATAPVSTRYRTIQATLSTVQHWNEPALSLAIAFQAGVRNITGPYLASTLSREIGLAADLSDVMRQGYITAFQTMLNSPDAATLAAIRATFSVIKMISDDEWNRLVAGTDVDNLSNALLFAVTGDAQAFLEWWTRHQPLAPVSATDQHMSDRTLLKLSAQCRALVKALSAHFAVIVPIEKLSETLTTAHGDNEELCRRLETDEPDSQPPSELLHAWAVIAGTIK